MSKNKKTKSEKKWCELSDFIKKEIDENLLNEFGLLYLVNTINDYRKIYGNKNLDYNETNNISDKISENIQKNLKRYNKNALIYLTSCITDFESKKSLFDFSKPYTSYLSSEKYFEQLFAKIINSNEDNDIEIERVCSWIVEYIKNALEIVKEKDENKIYNICVSFLTFFALSLMINYDINKGYEYYVEVINEFSNEHEVRFLLYYILYNILFYYSFAKSIYFKKTSPNIQSEKIKELYYKQFYPECKKEKFNDIFKNASQNFFQKIKCEIHIIDRILYENYKNTHSKDVYFSDSPFAEDIVKVKFNKTVIDKDDLHEIIQNIIKEL